MYPVLFSMLLPGEPETGSVECDALRQAILNKGDAIDGECDAFFLDFEFRVGGVQYWEFR